MTRTSELSVACVLCNEPTDQAHPIHRVCGIRSALGGIGHLLDHRYWCVVRQLPDAGLSWTASARCVDALVARYGIEAVVGGSFPSTSLEDVCGWAGVSV
jgi:hypothetical protein